MNAWLLLTILALATPPAASPTAPTSADSVQAVLLGAPTPTLLRSRLLDLSASTSRRRDAALALHYRALSFERASQGDSAIANYRRSQALQPSEVARTGLVDALLRRRKPEDLQEAIRLLETASEDTRTESGSGDPARLAWAYALSGDSRRAGKLIAPLETQLETSPQWQYRLARIKYANNDLMGAANDLTSLAVGSRGYDEEAVRLLASIAQRLGPRKRIKERVDELIQERNKAEGEGLARWHGRIVRFAAGDGATIGTYLFADSAARNRSPGVVVVRGPNDELGDYDSLVAGFRAARLPLMIVDPRGTGWSVDSKVPSPDTWEAREDALFDRVARDVRDALGVFGRVARVDTTRLLVVGIGPMTPVAMSVAEIDPRVAAVALIDPWVAPVDRGPVTAKAMMVPGYVQFGFMDPRDQEFASRLLESFGPQYSKRVDAGSLGQGVGAFARPEIRSGFMKWSTETLSKKPAPRPKPPKAR